MALTADQVKFRASVNMNDTPEGGGGPSPIVIESGKSNNIFPDISSTERAGGVVAHRQIHVAFDSGDNSVAQKPSIIVKRPPDDPNVSVIVMATEGDFATRAEDISKLEAYFIESGMYNGQLFGAHVRGMTAIVIMQREEAPLPAIGARLVLVFRETLADVFRQYVSVQRIITNVVQTFTDASGDFTRRILTIQIGEELLFAFPGFDAQRATITEAQLNQRTKIRSTVAAPAAKYFGTKPLVALGERGKFNVRVSSIFERLVPSAESEAGIANARVNAQINALMQSGNLIDYNVNTPIAVGSNLYIGGAVLPGSLAICPVAEEDKLVTDDGGMLMFAGLQVGTIDYANGIIVPLANVFPTARMLRIKYAPAVMIDSDVTSTGEAVTAENRRKTYVTTLPHPVVPGTLQVHYRALENWYVLTENGSGAVGNGNAAHGSGNWNKSTRTLTVGLGWLPDVGSAVIITYVVDTSLMESGNHVDVRERRLVIPLNSDGEISLEPGAKAFEPGQVLVQWKVGETTSAAWDDGLGQLSGNAAGTVNYQHGNLILIPDELPPVGTIMIVKSVTHNRSPQPVVWADAGSGALNATLPEPAVPGTLRIPISIELSAGTTAPGYAKEPSSRTFSGFITDNKAGDLLINGVNVGEVDHATGAMQITIDQAAADALAASMTWDVTRIGQVNMN